MTNNKNYSVKVHYQSPRSSIPNFIIALIVGISIFLLGYYLEWTDEYMGLVIGASILAVIIGFIGGGLLIDAFSKKSKKKGDLSFDGVVLKGPEDSQKIDLSKQHLVEFKINSKNITIVFGPAGEGKLTQPLSFIALSVKGFNQEKIKDMFAFPGFINSKPFKLFTFVLDLDLKNHEYKSLFEALINAVHNYRKNNIRYQVFSTLPWDEPVKSRSKLLIDIKANISKPIDVINYSSSSAQNPEEASFKIIAHAYKNVKLWLHDQVGLTADSVLICKKIKKNQCSFTILPLGARNLKIREDIYHHQMGGASALRVGSTMSYPAFVFESDELDRPLWVHFEQEEWFDREHYFDAVIEFVNSR